MLGSKQARDAWYQTSVVDIHAHNCAGQILFENFGTGADIESLLLSQVHTLAEKVGAEWTKRGGRLSKDLDTNLVWLDLDAAGIETKALIKIGKRHGVTLDGPRIVCHITTKSTRRRSRLSLVFLMIY